MASSPSSRARRCGRAGIRAIPPRPRATRPTSRACSRRSSRATGRTARSGREHPEVHAPADPRLADLERAEPDPLLVDAAVRALLRAAAARGAPRARARRPRLAHVLAGLPNESWLALRSIYRAGGRGAFDAVALHPYTGQPQQRDQARRVRAPRDAPRPRPPPAGLDHRAVAGRREGQGQGHPRLRHDERRPGAASCAPPRAAGRGAQPAEDRAGLLVHVAAASRAARTRSTTPACGGCATAGSSPLPRSPPTGARRSAWRAARSAPATPCAAADITVRGTLPVTVKTMRMALCAASAVGSNMHGQPPSITAMPCSRP